MAANAVNALQTLIFFTYGTFLLAEPGKICVSQLKTGLYTWFIITYVMYALAFLGTACVAIFATTVLMNTPAKAAPESSSQEGTTTPLTYQAEAPYKDV